MDGNSSAFGKLYSSVDDWVAKSQKQFSEIDFIVSALSVRKKATRL